jgi:hypothetical protein
MAVELVPLPASVVATAGPDVFLDPLIEHRVDEQWAKALIERPGLVDGLLFSVDEVTDEGFRGSFVPYRRVVASLADRELALELGVAPLAVTGRTVSSDGCAMLGVRSAWSTQEPGQLEFVPSGGVDEQARTGSDRVDPALTLGQELLEELGVERASVRVVVPRVLAIDETTRVHDLVFDVHLNVTAAELVLRHDVSPSVEHDHLQPTPLGELARLSPPTLSAVTRAIVSLPFTTMEMS